MPNFRVSSGVGTRAPEAQRPHTAPGVQQVGSASQFLLHLGACLGLWGSWAFGTLALTSLPDSYEEHLVF